MASCHTDGLKAVNEYFVIVISTVPYHCTPAAPFVNPVYIHSIQSSRRVSNTGCTESPKTLEKQVVTQLFVIVHTSS
jgi:hypothetical protein